MILKTNNKNGKKLAITIGLYLIAKAILNIILSGGFSAQDLLLAVFEALALYTGLMYINYVVAVLLLLTVLTHLKTNLSDIGAHLIYLIEAAIDVVCAVLLLTKRDIKEHFTNKWSEIGKN